MSAMKKKDVKTVHTTHNGALILFNACNAAKVFTEVVDLANAQALVKLLEAKVPRLRKAGDIPTQDQDEWLITPVSLKLTASVFETAKKGLDSFRTQGLLSGQKAVYDVLSAFNIIEDHDLDELLHLNAPTMDEAVDLPTARSAASA